jgi:predicted metal-dependent HD superfamily phosphohydrolase
VRALFARDAVATELKLIALPHSRPPTPPVKSAQRARANFRQRYDDLESRRAKLIERVTALGDAARRHTGYQHALKLLNDTFRKASLAQRLAVLEAAAWFINVLEKTIGGG